MKTVGIIGGGNMGSAIISRIRKNFKINVCEQDWTRGEELRKKFKVTLQSLPALVKSSDIIIVAVKPQDIDNVLANMKAAGAAKKVVISIAAGITISFIEGRLGDGSRVIRTMPNMPAMIGEGMTAIAKGANATKTDMTVAEKIFNAIGKTMIVDEGLIDAITAVSGSGPAYVFLFAECFMKAAQSVGLDVKISQALVSQTLLGSVHLMEKQTEEAAALRAKVTSKGGTTEAAMDIFFSRNIDKIFEDALTAARDRAKELSRR